MIDAWFDLFLNMTVNVYLTTALVILGILVLGGLFMMGFTWDELDLDFVEVIGAVVAAVVVSIVWPLIAFLAPFVLVLGLVCGGVFGLGYYIRKNL